MENHTKSRQIQRQIQRNTLYFPRIRVVYMVSKVTILLRKSRKTNSQKQWPESMKEQGLQIKNCKKIKSHYNSTRLIPIHAMCYNVNSRSKANQVLGAEY